MSGWSETWQAGARSVDLDCDGDTLREECGVFGIYGHPDAAAITALGLHALQHRGQEAAGIVSFNGHVFHLERKLGLVGDSFSEGAICQSTTDTEVIVHLVARSRKSRVTDRFVEAIQQIEGAYALVALSNKKLIGARDPLGIRPLVIGELDGRYILTSETCALDIIGARFVRDVENGEVVVISDEGVESFRFAPKQPARPDIFKNIYFARPDSVVNGHSVYAVRKNMGHELAVESPADADVVIPVPDFGV